MNIEVVVGDKIVVKKECNETGSCFGDIPQPGKGVWCHITIRVSPMGEDPSFTLTLSEYST